MTERSVKQRIAAIPVREGAGVLVHRTIGTPALRHLDPFLLLDHFSNENPDDYIAGFPDHPHRGFNTFTYMLDGHMQHQDSMGNRGDLRAGGGQWMKAASGLIHSEMPKQSEGLMRGFQLWINLPASKKMSDPGYQEYSPEAFPKLPLSSGGEVRVIIGRYGKIESPIVDPDTEVQYLDVSLAPGTEFRNRIAAEAAFVYVFQGDAAVVDTALATHTLGVLGPGDELSITAGLHGARLILVGGRPLGEPIVQYGPFVMTSRQEVERALDDYRRGRLVQKKASFVGR